MANQLSYSGKSRIHAEPCNVSTLKQTLVFPFSERTAINRFLKAPMTERLCKWNAEGENISARGVPTPEYLNLYRRWGEGEIGVVVMGNIMVRYDAVEAYGNPILVDDHDNRLAKFRAVAQAAKAHGSLVVAQLNHPGRQGTSNLNPNPVSASDVQLRMKNFNKPRALTTFEIKEMVKSFGETASLAHRAGFDGIQVHCAHGYLLAQFLSPTTNLRTDEYGGSLPNRARIVLEIIDEIHQRVPDPSFIVSVKLNCVEFQDKGTTPQDARDFCLMLEQKRVDFVELSGGTFEKLAFVHEKESTRRREAYFIEFAEKIRKSMTATKVYITGGFRSAGAMVNAVETSACDGIGLGRPLAAEPYLCKEILNGTVSSALESLAPIRYITETSGSQIHQIGYGDELISDFSDLEEVQRWNDAKQLEEERQARILPVVDASGYPRLKAKYGFGYLRSRL